MFINRMYKTCFVDLILLGILLQTKIPNVKSFVNSPKILTKDGNLIFESGLHRNISFRLNGNSSILINDDLDLTHLLFVKENGRIVNKNTDLTALEEMNLKQMLTEFQALQTSVKGPGGLETRLRRLSSRARISNQSVRRLQNRVQRVETKLEQFITRLEINNCSSNPCQNGGTCTPTYNGFICQCNQYYEGPTCSVDIDECVLYAGTDLGCQNKGVCVNQKNGFTCLCPFDWYGRLCNRRKNDCMQGSNWELCGHGVCVNSHDFEGYRCICDQGWKTNGKTPECSTDVDECSESHTPCQTKCINLPGSFTCAPCEAGLTGNGINCRDIDECAIGNGGCSVNPKVPCINTFGSFHCGECPNGWKGDGRTCTPTEITPIGRDCVDSSICHPSAKCSEISNTIVCSCPEGMVGNGFGVNGCRPDTSPCGKKPCQNGGTCIPLGSNFTCACPPNYLAPLCSTPTDPCLNNPCQNGGRCRVTPNQSFSCQCISGFKGDRCQNRTYRCGGTLTGPTGRLKYPLSSVYDHNSQCAWLIRTNESLVLNITFISFEIETATECRFDWLQMNDGRTAATPLIGRFCGNRKPKGGNIITSTNYLYLWFRSDNSTAKEGFELEWNSIPPQCGGLINIKSHGTISSPGSPGNYPKNRDCHWTLKAPTTKQIKLVFFSLQIEDHDTCNYDFLKITDSMSGSTLAEFCKSGSPSPLLLPSSNIEIHFHSDDDGNDGGFQIHYFLENRIAGCGGVFTAKEGEIKSPLVSSTEQVSCEYDIKIAPNRTISLQFNKVQLDSEECIQVFDVVPETEEQVLQLVYCGGYEMSPGVVNSQFNAMRIVYYGKKGDFSILYKSKCSMVYESKTDQISSPNYPRPQEAGEVCSYKIIAAPGYHIELNFIDFDIKSGLADDCSLNSLSITDGINGNVSGPYCSLSEPPGILLSDSYMLTLLLNTVSLENSRGFLLRYKSIAIESEGCGGVYTNTNTTIRLPTVDGHYKDNLNCTFVILAPQNRGILLSFLSFKLEESPECNYDYIEIIEETAGGTRSSLGRYCNSKKPPTIVTHSKMLILTFVSDISEGFDGFEAKFDFINTSGYCGDIYSSTGVLASPDWPLSYPNDYDCVWVINGPSGSQLELNVNAFDIEKSDDCTEDYLEIRNGGSNSSALIGKFCGKTIPRSIPSFTNQLYIHFHSNNFLTGKGFSMQWDVFSNGCGGKLIGRSGTITSPNYPNSYPHGAVCEWSIIAPFGSILEITFEDIDMEDFLSCTYDYVSISEVHTTSPKYLKKFCKMEDKSRPIVVLTKHNKALVSFRTDSTNSGKGFLLTYKANCTVTLTDIHGTIESPNYGNPSYRDEVDCVWTLKAPKGNRVSFEITNMEIVESSGSLEVRDGSKIFYITSPQAYESVSNEIQIILNDKLISFYLEYSMVGCIGLLTKPFGKFSSPNYPKTYPNDMECLWEIHAPEGQGVEFNIERMDIEQSTNCTKDYLLISSHLDDINPKQRHCGLQQDLTILGSHHVFVQFRSDESHNGVGFEATYNFTKKNCGGVLSSQNGIIESPNYPNLYSKNENCEWFINVDPGHTMTVSVDDIDLEDSYECQFDYVEMYDGEDSEANQLFRLCGSTNKVVRTSGSVALIRFQSDDSSEYKGFKISYHQNCGGTLQVKDDINAEVTKIQHNPSNETCEWTIISEDVNKHVSVGITHLAIYPSLAGQYSSEEACHNKGAKIYEGADSSGPMKLSFCNEHPPLITSEGHALTLQAPMNFISEIGFEYSLIGSYCGGLMNGLRGKFSSPSYPSSYPVDMTCEWFVYASEGNSIILTFESMDLEQSEECNNDFVELRESTRDGKLLGVYCGNSVPSPVKGFEGIWVIFRSNENIVGQGFLISYNYASHNELNATKGEIKSPRYPTKFETDEAYTYRITMDKKSAVVLNIEHILDIAKPLIKFYDGYSDIGDEIEYGTSNVITTSTNIMYIKAQSGPFEFKWNSISKDLVNENKTLTEKARVCGESIITVGNIIPIIFQSPGYPDGYAIQMNCSWIFVPENKATHSVIEIVKLDLEELGDCLADYIIISKSTNMKDWIEIKKLCKKPDQNLVQYEGNPYLKVQFITDMAINKTGFDLRLSTKCGSLLTDARGIINITRALGFRNNDVCDWTIEAKLGKRLRITFLDSFISRFNISSSCENYLLLRNGLAEDSPFLGNGKYCNNGITDVLVTTSNKAFIRFKYVNDYVKLKTVILYEEINSGCSQEYLLDEDIRYGNETVIVTTPNYPNIPHPFMECIWIIKAPKHHLIQIDFIDKFDLANNSKNDLCNDEYVQINDGLTEMKPVILKSCGLTKPNTIISGNNIIRIKYFSSINEPHLGFKVRLSLANCGGTYYDNKGVITSPKNLRYEFLPGKNYMECQYRIEAPEGYHIKINLDLQNFPSTASNQNCTDITHLELVELMRQNGQLAGEEDADTISDNIHLCGNNAASDYIVETNILKIVYKIVNFHDINIQFKVNYEAVGNRCGSKIYASTGILMTPNYPNGVKIHTNCIWYVRVPKGRRIKIEFIDYDTGIRSIGNNTSNSTNSQTSTSGDFVSNMMLRNSVNHFIPFFGRITFYNDFDMQSVIMRVKNNPPQYIYSSDNTMAIDAFLLSLNKHRGFKLRFTSEEATVYCNKYFDMEKGGTLDIVSMNNTVIYCQYKLKVEENTTFVMKVNHIQSVPNSLRSLILCSFKAPIKIFLRKEQIKKDFLCSDSQSSPDNTSPISSSPKILRLPYPIKMKLNYNSLIVGTTNISIDYKIHKCGGIKMLHSYANKIVINEPHMTNYNNSQLDCAWAIWPDESYDDSQNWDENIQIVVTLSLNLKGKCNNEYLILYNGPTQNSPRLGQFCNNQQNLTYIITKGFFFEYHTLNYDNTSTFELTAVESSGCGGRIKSPLRPIYFAEQYKNNVECIWDIKTDAGYHLSVNIVGRFFIESSPDCHKDYLLIQQKNFDDDTNENWTNVTKLCGREPPKFVNTTSHRLRMIFHSDESITGEGFYITFEKICGGVFYADKNPKTISSPGYPINYPTNLFCNYTILTKTNSNITNVNENPLVVRILDLSLEYNIAPNACYFDNMTIITKNAMGSPFESVICKGKNQEFQSFNSITVLFRTDSSSSSKGFQIEYSTNLCGGVVTKPGIITTPRYHLDNNFPPKSNCQWNITAGANEKILIKFEQFEFENQHQCLYDGVDIYKGHLLLNEQKIVKLCGNLMSNLPPIITISQNTALVHSFSDETNESKGFKAIIDFKQNCDQSIFLTNLNSTYIFDTYANSYNNNMDCTLIFSTIADQQLEVEFTQFHLEESEQCQNDFIELKDGAGAFADLIGRHCGHNIPNKITSSRNYLLMRFVTNNNYTSSGFKAKISMKPSLCGPVKHQITGKQVLNLTSPKDASGRYPNNLNCFYFIEGTRSIRLKFVKLDIVGNVQNHTCDTDYLKIYGKQDNALIDNGYGSEVMFNGRLGKEDYQNFALEHVYCGNTTPSDYYSFENGIYIRFHTDNENTATGFSILATNIEDCYAEQNGVSGRISITESDVKCDIAIRAPTNYSLSLFSSFLYFPETNCEKNYVEVISLKTNTSLEKTCGGKIPYTFFTNQSAILLRLAMDSFYSQYDFTYLASKNGVGCGGDFYTNQGSFTSPFYPAHVRENSDCRWNIRVPTNNHVLIIFEEFNLGARTTCRSDYLQIIEYDQNGDEHVVRQFCGEDRPKAYKSEKNYLSVRFRKSMNHDGTGFVIRFNGVFANYVLPAHYLN